MTCRQQTESAIKADIRRIYKNRLIVYPLLCIISLFLVLVSSCEEGFSYDTHLVTFENQSGDTIYYTVFYYFPKGSDVDKRHYDMEESDIIHILKHGERDEYLEIDDIQNEFLCILVFEKETWRKYGKEGLIENKNVDKRYVYNYEELQPMGFKITHIADSLSN